MQRLLPLIVRSGVRFRQPPSPPSLAVAWRGYCDGKDRLQTDHFSGTIAEVKQLVREEIGVPTGYHTVPKSREHLLQHQPKPEDLEARSMKDSYTRAVLPLTNDEVRERYVNHVGRVRMGRIMEDLDLFAVWLCHRHIKVPSLPPDIPLPYTFVTLLVDKVDIWNTLRHKANADIHLSGHVSWTGRSSMEITIYVNQEQKGESWTITKAIILMVARNATNTGPAPVNALKPADELEQRLLEEASKRQKLRKRLQAQSIFISPPHEYEQSIMYRLFKRTTPMENMELNRRVLPPKCRWMSDSHQTTMIDPFPENRNAQNTIFGGYIMRNAIEISFITASMYVQGRPILKCISDISFMNAVKVSSFLKMTAYVVYTAQNYMQIMTVAHIYDARSGEDMTTNTFYLVYKSDNMVDEVLPRTYHETLWYIHGRRKFLSALDLLPDYPLNEAVKPDAKGAVNK